MRFFLVFIVIFFNNFPFQAQTKLLNPDEFLGYPIGSQYTFHHRLVDYAYHLSMSMPENVKVFQYGKTNEDRPLILVAISSKENISNLDEIRKENLKRVGFENGTPTNNIAIVWLSCSVHGNEAAGSESSMKTMYKLLNPNHIESKNWLKNTVVLIDISVNPDGYSRYTNWFKQVSHNDPNNSIESREHQEPWPRGRVNHYYFDLNRDWAWLAQKESQQRIEIYKQWMPHVVADIHEMGYNEPYYFAPAAQPYHQYLTNWQKEFQYNFGRNHAKHFDQKGWLYFTREIFDLYYPSYGDTYPMFNGAIGMTYEQGGIRGGRSIIMENEEILTLKDRIEHHYTASMSTIEVASQNAEKLCTNFSKFYDQARNNPQGTYKTYIIKNTNQQNKIIDLCKLLDAHKIKYGSTSSKINITGFDYVSGKEVSTIINNNDLVISAYQPMSVLTQVLFDPENTINDSLTYDITAWGLPYAYGLDAIASKQKIIIDKPYEITEITFPVGSNYAYVADWSSSNNITFVSQLLKNGFKVKVAEEQFSIDSKNYPAGTLVITKGDNVKINENFDTKIIQIAKENHQNIFGIKTGFADNGRDIGSSHTRLISTPKVGLIWDEDTDENAFGFIWNFFEQRINYPITILKSKQLNSNVISKYNTIILPNGFYSFDNGLLEKLKNWVSDGGKIIALENAISTFEDKSGFNVTRFADKKDKEEFESTKESLENRLKPYHCSERCSVSDGNPGAIVKNIVDNSHPLAFGFPNYYYSLKTNSVIFGYLKDTWNVIRTEGEPKVIGFIGKNIKDQLKNVSTASVQQIGRGNVIYLTDCPLFRGFWHQGELLFGNALFMVK